ncbi:hypothetical protein L1987_08643 [Smallanthus sonchifolius]|uniref:Uncharacterized protein n=1 Tax=Smallanthus sonchifolius TaxID=185202 RepID=A0ACB9JN01_9ASTR|nr:hypothetical protein L1987_08643 [Smallanthus sonchifolius]
MKLVFYFIFQITTQQNGFGGGVDGTNYKAYDLAVVDKEMKLDKITDHGYEDEDNSGEHKPDYDVHVQEFDWILSFRINYGLGGIVPEAAGLWPIIGHLHLLAGSQVTHKLLGSMADKLGSIFTIKLGVHRVLVVSSSEMAKECLTTNDRVFASRPKAMATELMGYN